MRVDAIRADGEFEIGADDDLGLFWAYDPYWRQAYGTLFADAAARLTAGDAKNARRLDLRLEAKEPKLLTLAPGETQELVRYLFPAANTFDVRAVAHELRGKSLVEVNLPCTIRPEQWRGPTSRSSQAARFMGTASRVRTVA